MRDVKPFEEYLDRMVEKYRIPGIAVSVTGRDGDVRYETFKGYRSYDEKLPVTPATIFGMPSLTKSFTAICIFPLYCQGIIHI